MEIILGTTSPYRKEAFSWLGIDFKAEGSDVDESKADRSDPEELVKTLSRWKAEAVAKRHPDAVVIGMDSIGYFDGAVLEKPKSREEGFNRLKRMSGNSFQFYTGITMIRTSDGDVLQQVVKTDADLREIADDEIDKYLDEDPKYDTYALGFDPAGHFSSTFIKGIKGSYNNILQGIPLEVIIVMLKQAMKK